MADAVGSGVAETSLAQPVKLDDLMLAMDVVDTLRHQDFFVARELDEETREQELIARLRRIYHDQGIEVSDSTIEEGVKALKESRFVYTPPRPGLGVALARLWIARGKIAAVIAGLIGAVGLGLTAYYFLVERPAALEVERAQIELTQNLPKALDAAYAGIIAEAKTPAARPKADQLLADGKSALAREDAADAKAALGGLQQLAADLRKTYQLVIVARQGEFERRVPHPRPQYRGAQLLSDRRGGRARRQAAGAADHERRRRQHQNGHEMGPQGGPEEVQFGRRRQGGRRHHPEPHRRRKAARRARRRLLDPDLRRGDNPVVTA